MDEIYESLERKLKSLRHDQHEIYRALPQTHCPETIFVDRREAIKKAISQCERLLHNRLQVTNPLPSKFTFPETGVRCNINGGWWLGHDRRLEVSSDGAHYEPGIGKKIIRGNEQLISLLQEELHYFKENLKPNRYPWLFTKMKPHLKEIEANMHELEGMIQELINTPYGPCILYNFGGANEGNLVWEWGNDGSSKDADLPFRL